jgi:hypothetical protein
MIATPPAASANADRGIHTLAPAEGSGGGGAMITNATQCEKPQEEIRSLEERLARLHEEFALYEGSEESGRSDLN